MRASFEGMKKAGCTVAFVAMLSGGIYQGNMAYDVMKLASDALTMSGCQFERVIVPYVPNAIDDIIRKQKEAFGSLSSWPSWSWVRVRGWWSRNSVEIWKHHIWLSDVAKPKMPRSKIQVEHLFEDTNLMRQWIQLLQNIRTSGDHWLPMKVGDLRSFREFWNGIPSSFGVPEAFMQEVLQWTDDEISRLCDPPNREPRRFFRRKRRPRGHS